MADKHADLKCSLTIALRGGGVLVVPGITVEKAENYSSTLFQCAAHPDLRDSPLNLYGNDGAARVRLFPGEMAGTNITVWGESGPNPWATADPAGYEDVELPLGDLAAEGEQA